MCNAKGSLQNQTSLYCFYLMLKYWSDNEMSVMALLRNNHTVFSEESGEVALSVLSQGQPPSTRAKLEQVRKQWQLIRRSDFNALDASAQ